MLLSQFPELKVIVLDDAFQHRKVKPGLSILLADYGKMFYDDYLLPVGTLREWRAGKKVFRINPRPKNLPKKYPYYFLPTLLFTVI